MFSTQQRIRFDDVDGAGIVYYPRFFHLCHTALEDFFNALGPVEYSQLIKVRRRGFPTVHIESDFYRPLVYGDVANIHLEVLKVGNTSVHFRYRIHRNDDVDKAFEARIITAYLDLDITRPVVVEADVRALLEQHLVAVSAAPAGTA